MLMVTTNLNYYTPNHLFIKRKSSLNYNEYFDDKNENFKKCTRTPHITMCLFFRRTIISSFLSFQLSFYNGVGFFSRPNNFATIKVRKSNSSTDRKSSLILE
ncbi:hypothetical protein WA026_018385 [Henosepilachna vigintioctopunctata]|uniref:Uncharacterized protein n=1 Tax=Henosepilachna vigintioctopunctata TaxID=420089 RepID=A0AAW1V0R8_9CUCU